MSQHHDDKKFADETGAPVAAAAQAHTNYVPLDEAPRIPLGSGRIGRYGLCPVNALIPNPHRVMVHPERQLKKLERAIEVSGQLSPVVIDEAYMILAGHARLEVATRKGDSTLPVVQIFGLSSAQKRNFLLADNRIGSDAKLDRKALADQLPELRLLFEDAELEFTDTGFEVAEFDDLELDFGDELAGSDEAVEAELFDEIPVLQVGDLLALGEHRLIVGDAREDAILGRLMEGELAEAAFLDVPYNRRVREIGGRGRVKHPEFAFASGEMSKPEFTTFLSVALRTAARFSEQGAVHFVCIDWRHVRDLIEAGEQVYGKFLDLVVWAKTNAGNGGLYRSQHELLGVFRVGEETHRDNVQKGRFGRNRSNLWTYAGANTFRAGRLEDLTDHPTIKPTALVADALKDVTAPGGIVLDTFVGSGTTILAGERVGRRVRAAEIEPRYAQVAVRRWEAMTGRQAVHVESGLTFEALARQRRHETQIDPATPETTTPVVAEPPRPRLRTRPRSHA